MIAFDTTVLSLLFVPEASSYSTREKKPIKHSKERIEALVNRIAKSGEAIIIPTPALSEMLVKIPPEQINPLLATLNGSPWFRVESFDSMAAVELATRTAQALASGDKREGLQADWTKVKFDRQIVAIAIVNGANEIISDDLDVAAIGARWNFKVTSVEDLPIPADQAPPPLFASLETECDEAETSGKRESESNTKGKDSDH